ncbi:MAG: methyltransferase domain-containing protein [Phycisphaerae bacterium]|nr:methyltransferase domain-containing protein [Phycisphaerae bacterium]
MSDPEKQSARTVALDVLDQFDRRRTDIRQILHDRIDAIGAAGVKAGATDIVFGVLRNGVVIDRLINRCSGVPDGHMRKRIHNVLRIGMYELVYVPAAPEHAVVNEAVNLARAVAGKRDAGFVNAILRNATRMIRRRTAPLGDAAATRCIPHDTQTGCEFAEDVLCSPQQEPAGYLAQAYSLPQWLVGEWLTQFGFDKSQQVAAASNRRPGIYLQPNTLKTSAAGLAEKFDQADIEYRIIADAGMLKLKTHMPIASLPGFDEGLFTVQDPTAASVVTALRPTTGQTLLDLCAAPGGKTVRLAQLMNDQGRIVATDVDAKRLAAVRENCARLGITAVECVPWTHLAEALTSSTRWDGVLVDAPCSNTGVMARRPEVRMRVTPEAVRSLAQIQAQLLEQAADAVAPGGHICYSTCSIQTSENMDVVEALVKRRPEFLIERHALTLPFVAEDLSFDHDGGFVAVLLRQH